MRRVLLLAALAVIGAACTGDNPDYVPPQLQKYIDDGGHLRLPGELPDLVMSFPPDPDLGPLPPDMLPAPPDLFMCENNRNAEGWCCLPAFSSGCTSDKDCCDYWFPESAGSRHAGKCHEVRGEANRCCVETAPNVWNCAP